MNILLNGAVTLSADPQGGNFIITGVTGLGAADIRTSSFLYSGRSGGMITEQFFGFRNISITGRIGSPTTTRAQHAIDRAALFAALPLTALFPIYITLFNGETYRADVRLTDIKLEYMPRGFMSDFLIQLTAPDPLFYSTAGGDVQSAIVERLVDNGGYVTPYILPVVWDSGGAPTIVNNSGNATVYPVLIIHDTSHDPIITNMATGENFALSINTNDGDELEIDMLNRTVKLNGSDVIGNKVDGSTWWGLLPGDNSLKFDTDTATDNGYVDVTWRNGVTGV